MDWKQQKQVYYDITIYAGNETYFKKKWEIHENSCGGICQRAMFDCQRINLAMEGVLTKRLNACNFHGLAQCVKGKLESWDVDLIGFYAPLFSGGSCGIFAKRQRE